MFGGRNKMTEYRVDGKTIDEWIAEETKPTTVIILKNLKEIL